MTLSDRLFVFVLIALTLVPSCKSGDHVDTDHPDTCPPPKLKFGYDVNQHSFDAHRIHTNAIMANVLMEHNVPYQRILEIERNADTVFSLRKLQAGKSITFVREDPCYPPKSFVYQPDPFSFVKFQLDTSAAVSKHDIPYEVKKEYATGVVKTSLWQAMYDEGFDLRLIDKMEDAVAQVNFHFTNPGDQFKLVYDMLYVDGKPVTSGKIHSAAFRSDQTTYYGFYFENDKYQGYYDEKGTPNKKTFLNAPVRYSRISSFYNKSRLHPVLKYPRPHLGTDYAAPKGTEIFAVADGVITHRSYTRGNGNYVKIKHDKTYQTQYLHMSAFKKGQRVGSRVKQGEVIGYIGKTGLATGYHVCFRFWKNGRQVNHRLENFPPLNPMDDDELPTYFLHRDSLLKELDSIPFVDYQLIEEIPL